MLASRLESPMKWPYKSNEQQMPDVRQTGERRLREKPIASDRSDRGKDYRRISPSADSLPAALMYLR